VREAGRRRVINSASGSAPTTTRCNLASQFLPAAARRRNAHYDGAPPDPTLTASMLAASWPLSRVVSLRAYPSGTARYHLLCNELADHTAGTVLDVGSRSDTFTALTGRPCELIDKNNPELATFDWDRAPLPYADGSFDTIICLDTLEHLEDPYRALDDLFRVSRRSVIVSLPNCWRRSVLDFLAGRGREPSYGLPLEPPRDRHRWFFNSADAFAFLLYRTLRSPFGYAVRDVRLHVPARRWWQRALYPLLQRLLPRHFTNLLARTLFVVMERR